MSKIKHDISIRLVKFVSILLSSLCFGVVWFIYYAKTIESPFYKKGNYLVILLFAILFFTFAKIYDSFKISINSIYEVAYSQILAIIASDGIIYLVTMLLEKGFPNILPLVCALFFQSIFAVMWSYFANHWYFRTFPPKKSVVVYDLEFGFERLIKEYNLEKKYNILETMTVEECLSNLDSLKEIETVFIRGVHSRDRNIILKYCIEHSIEVLVIPRVGDVLMSSSQPIHMFHLPILKVNRYNASLEYLFIKRFLDILLSLVAIIVLSPIMLGVALAIKISDGGPIIYSQVRLTKDGKKFKIYKFRSMRTDAEKDGVARLSTGDSDDRITPVGKVIRKYRLDELPQLFNILGGSLSICGPRPERPEIAEQYCEEMPEFSLRLQAKAGLTGYAQVYGKYNTTPYDKLQMDLMYIAHPSLIEDIKIILATVKILFMKESTEGIEEGKLTAVK